MFIRLPNGLLDGMDLFNFAEIDEIRGKQQNYLVDKELVINNIGHVPKLLEELVLALKTEQGLQWKGNIKDAIWKLPIGDLETILIKIRENTYGPKLYHRGVCEHCGHEHANILTELDKLEIKSMSIEDMMKPKVIVLPKSKLEVELKPAYLKDAFEALKIVKDKQKELITSSLVVDIKRIGDKTNITSKDIETIPAMDLQYLSQESKKFTLEGSIDTHIVIECEKCKKDFSMKLNSFDPSFFFPTEESTN